MVLTWKAPLNNGGSSITKYQVQRRTGKTWEDTQEVTGTSYTYTYTDLTNGTPYEFRVQARNAAVAEWGDWSSGARATPHFPPPTIESHESVNHGEIRLTWKPVDDATSYDVAQKKSLNNRRDPDWEILPAAKVTFTVTASLVTAVIGGLDPGEDYKHRVRSRNARGPSPTWSGEKTTTVLDKRPAKPTLSKTDVTEMIGGRGIALRWDHATRATSYNVKLSSRNPSTHVDVDNNSAEVTGLTPDKKYTFTVVATNKHGDSESDAVKKKAPTPAHWRGHQADHTVAYVIGTIGNSVIRNAIAPAVSDWKTELAIVDKGLEICLSGACVNSNSDGFTVTIKTVNKDNDSKEDKPPKDHNKGCGWSYACVKRGTGSTSSPGPGRHMGNITMVFEDPPVSWEDRKTKSPYEKLWEWTRDLSKHDKRVPGSGTGSNNPERFYAYVDRVMLHEFGHTLGLPEFYEGAQDDTRMHSLDAVMNKSNAIKAEDRAQLKAIYLLHNPH